MSVEVSSPLQQESNSGLWALQQASLLTEPSHPPTICFLKSWIFLTRAAELKRRKRIHCFLKAEAHQNHLARGFHGDGEDAERGSALPEKEPPGLSSSFL